jgi:hypothetical protein
MTTLQNLEQKINYILILMLLITVSNFPYYAMNTFIFCTILITIQVFYLIREVYFRCKKQSTVEPLLQEPIV